MVRYVFFKLKIMSFYKIPFKVKVFVTVVTLCDIKEFLALIFFLRKTIGIVLI